MGWFMMVSYFNVPTSPVYSISCLVPYHCFLFEYSHVPWSKDGLYTDIGGLSSIHFQRVLDKKYVWILILEMDDHKPYQPVTLDHGTYYVNIC
jgi:hypothetical protein